MNMRHFTTSFGHTIELVDNYRQFLPPPRDNSASENASDIYGSGGGIAKPESDFGLLSDLYQFAMMADWLESVGLFEKNYEYLLDIGGSTGLIGTLFKAMGKVQKVDNIEILDFQNSSNLPRLCQFLAAIQAQKNTLFESLPTRGNQISSFDLLAHLEFMYSTFPYKLGKGSYYWKLDPGLDFSLDRYMVSDYFLLEEKYDFLLSATTMQHFSIKPFLEKAYSLLKQDGILFIWNAYWYWVLPVISVFGDFPWMMQRLTREDQQRYFEEFWPEESENSMKSRLFFHKDEGPYTLSDYIRLGEEAGFKLVNYRRLTPATSAPGPRIGAWSLNGDHGFNVQKSVLRDIHCFRSDVKLIDLVTQSVFIAFQKQ